MAGMREVDAKGYFDVEVVAEGPFAKPPTSCFLDGLQVATGATWGKRNIESIEKDTEDFVVRVKNTRTTKSLVSFNPFDVAFAPSAPVATCKPSRKHEVAAGERPFGHDLNIKVTLGVDLRIPAMYPQGGRGPRAQMSVELHRLDEPCGIGPLGGYFGLGS